MSDNVIRPERWLQNGQTSLDAAPQQSDGDERDRLGGDGGGPHLPGMEPRVAALEADMKDVKGILYGMKETLARIDERSQQAATKADIATLGGRVGEIDARLKTAEGSISTALTAAIGKAIGPLQAVGLLAGCITVLVAAAGAINWLVAHGWLGRAP